MSELITDKFMDSEDSVPKFAIKSVSVDDIASYDETEGVKGLLRLDGIETYYDKELAKILEARFDAAYGYEYLKGLWRFTTGCYQ